MSYGGWAPYVPVAKRRAKAKKKMDALRKKGRVIKPVEIRGNKIAKTFWGKAWCDHIEQFSDYANRLPRGRTYARNGSVCHLEIKQGHIHAMVSGSDIYTVNIDIKPLPKPHWNRLKQSCAGGISSILELLQGKISDSVMAVMTSPTQGLFPEVNQITFRCNCPDGASMCKHIAAVLYGVGARLDNTPQDLFLLRGVDEKDLINADVELPKASTKAATVSGDLGNIFGIDLDMGGDKDLATNTEPNIAPAKPKKTAKKSSAPSASRKKRAIKKKNSSLTTASSAPDHGINISSGIRASHIKRLCKFWGMTHSQFAKTIGKSPATVKLWQEKKGVLTLHQSSRDCLEQAFRLSLEQAWDQYRDSK